MDIRKVKKLIDLLEKSGVHEIEIKEGDQTVRISRAGMAPPMPVAAPVAQPAAPAAPATPAADTASDTALADDAPPADPNVVTVQSPMVGTFYSAPSPGEDPFVKENQEVKAEETICIIEAMKTMNQIKAPVDGVVVKIHPANGDPIEYNQALIDIRKA